MTNSTTHEGCRAGGVVSVWLGHIRNECEMDDYLSERFMDAFGFRINPNDGPEYEVSAERKPVHTLLDGFSFGSTFVREAVAGAIAAGWSHANCALVFYNFRYKPEFSRDPPDSPLQFIGTFKFGRPA